MTSPTHYIAFEGQRRLASGRLPDVVLTVKQSLDAQPDARVLVFNQSTSELVDFDYRGTPDQVLQRLSAAEPAAAVAPPVPAEPPPPAGPGRPRLGVVAREVTLLPRHWEWLSRQAGGASVALRKLVDQARRANESADAVRAAQEVAYRFMSTMAGNLQDFEEAARALFAPDPTRFGTLIASWPTDIRDHLQQLATPAFGTPPPQEQHHA